MVDLETTHWWRTLFWWMNHRQCLFCTRQTLRTRTEIFSRTFRLQNPKQFRRFASVRLKTFISNVYRVVYILKYVAVLLNKLNKDFWSDLCTRTMNKNRIYRSRLTGNDSLDRNFLARDGVVCFHNQKIVNINLDCHRKMSLKIYV